MATVVCTYLYILPISLAGPAGLVIRSKGGKANYFDENGRNVGKGNGDLNH